MKNLNTEGLDEARKRLMKALPIERIRQVKRFKNITSAQYLQLLDRLEELSRFLVRSFMKKQPRENTT